MKCFSVHMKLGVIEGIPLQGEGKDLLKVGNSKWHSSWLYVRWNKKIQTRPSILMKAEIIFHNPTMDPIFRTLKGYDDPIATLPHIVVPGADCAKDRALVRIGAFSGSNDFIPLKTTEDGSLAVMHGSALGKKNQTRVVTSGGHFSKSQRRFVYQCLYILKRGGGILLLSRIKDDPDMLVCWDGNELTLTQNPDLSQIIA